MYGEDPTRADVGLPLGLQSPTFKKETMPSLSPQHIPRLGHLSLELWSIERCPRVEVNAAFLPGDVLAALDVDSSQAVVTHGPRSWRWPKMVTDAIQNNTPVTRGGDA